jgi:P27 family predicted phage terminase small subunit
MGRLADAPGLQAGKGHPGRRRSAVRRREEEAQRVAELLATAPAEGGDAAAPPALIDRGPLTAAAIAVWRELAPKLAKTHRLQPQHRPIFAMFCVYFAEWVIANEDVLAKGHIQNVKTVAGGAMERMRPIVIIRDRAFEMVMKLSDRFGLTPSDEYALFKDQAIAAAQNPGLFDHRPGEQRREEEPADGALTGGAGIVGVARRMDSEPPPPRLN